MPNRLIRESLLDSERYWSCTIEARELYRHMQLLADDFGCLSLAPVFLGRRCFDSRPTDEKFASLLNQLCDADLVRRYEVNDVPFGFLPRFGQRLKRFTLKHPKPPECVLQGDVHAIELFAKINAISKIPAAPRQPSGRPPAPEEKRREVEVEVEVKPLAQSDPAKGAASSSHGAVVITMPLADKSEFPILAREVAEWEELYPGVDVMQTLKEIRGWNLANPTRRKTKAGILRHVNQWLAKEQNYG